jgi:ethanolamine ammonia-lyase small subunit
MAPDRDTYLRQPRLGARLNPESRRRLRAQSGVGRDAVMVVADGLAPRAAEAHALPVLRLAVPRLEAAGWRIGPLVVAEQAAVELGDEIGAAVGAHLAVTLLGERPEPDAAASLAIYLTWDPAPGRTTGERSRIAGIASPTSYPDAAATLVRLMTEARARRHTGAAPNDHPGASGG